MIYCLIILLTVILFLGYVSMERDIASPPVLFVGPFLVANICAAVYGTKWNLDMHLNTFCVLFFGCLIFTFEAWLVHMIVAPKLKNMARRRNRANRQLLRPIEVSLWKILLIIGIQLFSILIVSHDMRTAVGRYGITGNFQQIMYWYREYHMFSEDKDVKISSLASNIRLLSIAVNYIWIYVICNNLTGHFNNKNLVSMTISIGLGIINCVILGARGDAIQLFVAAFVIFVFLQRKHNGWKSNIKLRHIILTSIVLFAIMYGFKASGDILGRSSVTDYHTSAMDELAKYLGAEIKNLDIYLEKPFKKSSSAIIGSQTFGNALGWLSNKFHLGWKIGGELPFQKVNGISLGNVYTAFYAYIYDFGYAGLVVLTIIMSTLVQLIYEYSIIENKKTVINLGIIVNSYVLFLVTFSFFGERFYAYLVNISMIKYLILWALVIEFSVGKRFRL